MRALIEPTIFLLIHSVSIPPVNGQSIEIMESPLFINFTNIYHFKMTFSSRVISIKAVMSFSIMCGRFI